MALTDESHGTQAATLGTDHTLATLAGGKVYALLVDTNALANGETLELWAMTKVLTGGTVREVFHVTFVNAQGSPIKQSLPVLTMWSCEFHLKQTGGTGRSFDWTVVSE